MTGFFLVPLKTYDSQLPSGANQNYNVIRLYMDNEQRLKKLDGVGPADNRPSTDKHHHFFRKKKIKKIKILVTRDM